ncbi:MAG: asparagine--tRNA ligase, partial [Bacteroidia bacterium]|nr:asparagine--tRNA ligase [Bacteroidia bacterium]
MAKLYKDTYLYMQAFLIKDLKDYERKEVTLKGWASNRRDSKGIYFIILRDGTGWCQCVVSADSVSEEVFNECKKISIETAIEVTGTIRKDEKQLGGYEMQATHVNIISVADEYPISKKEHGVDFLMDKRHLWLRSQRQWAIMKIRNQIIYSIHQFFQNEGFVQMDAPLFTANASEGTTN